VELKDIVPDGRVLLARVETRLEVAVGQIGGENRPLSWLDYQGVQSISRDGKFAVVGAYRGAAGTDYHVYLAKLDGSPAILLGNGLGGGISPDNKWVTSILPTDTTKVLLLPIGIGETKTISSPNFHYRDATWTSDGRQLVVRASESGRPTRFWGTNLFAVTNTQTTIEGLLGLDG
jgi:hypothetical protein